VPIAVTAVVVRAAGVGSAEILAALQKRCDSTVAARSVMLHLRSCYVSKAAIFTIPSPP
jgi:hypothetical protein